MNDNRLIICSVLLIIGIFFAACRNDSSSIATTSNAQYAKGFSIINHSNYTEVFIFNPWEEARLLGHYFLSKDTSQLPHPLPDDAIIVQTPIERLAVTSATHVGFLNALHKTNTICAICNPELVYTTIPNSADCVNLGSDLQINIEQLFLSHPGAVMLSTYGQADAMRTLLEKTNIPIIYNNEWTEQSPLARAEWIRLAGAFLDKQEQADSIFAQVEQEYLYLKDLVSQSITDKRTIIAGNSYRGTWYMPSGKVYTGQLYCDAGADYYYQNDSTNGSLPLSIETVIRNFHEADVWVNVTFENMQQLKDADEKHTWFKAYQDNEVYNFNKRSNQYGANDFWEGGVVHPEIVLKDLIYILYPDILPDHQLYFTNHLE